MNQYHLSARLWLILINQCHTKMWIWGMAGENAIRYSMLPNVIVVICGNIEPQVTLAQFLDQHFMWWEHIKIICNETCKNIWILSHCIAGIFCTWKSPTQLILLRDILMGVVGRGPRGRRPTTLKHHIYRLKFINWTIFMVWWCNKIQSDSDYGLMPRYKKANVDALLRSLFETHPLPCHTPTFPPHLAYVIHGWALIQAQTAVDHVWPWHLIGVDRLFPHILYLK